VSRIYSHRLWVDHTPTAGTFSTPLGVAGETVVIRSIDVTPMGDAAADPGLQGWSFFETSGTILWKVTRPFVVAQQTYSWRGNQIMAGGDELFLEVDDANTHWWVSGFRLSPP
jgi:hypothetical protein